MVSQTKSDLFSVDYGAIFSPDRVHRFALWKIADLGKPIAMFIGLNPSKATVAQDDNTITKVSKIAAYNGFGGFYMLNLFTFITPYPEELETTETPGTSNEFLLEYAKKVNNIIFCWGSFEQAKQRGLEIQSIFKSAWCLEINDDYSPKHPLYCKDKSKIQRFAAPPQIHP